MRVRPHLRSIRFARPTRLGLVVAMLLSAPSGASAQGGCPPPIATGPLEFTPADGSRGVTLGAPVIVRYSAGYLTGATDAELATMIEVFDGSGARVDGHVAHLTDETLSFVSFGPLSPATTYDCIANGRARDTARVFSFRTGTSFDLSAPTFAGILSATASEVGASCEASEGGFRISIACSPASDDGPLGDIEYLIYQTRGPLLTAPRLVSRVRNFASDQIVTAFVLPSDEAVSAVCVTAFAVDGVGRHSAAAEPRCFEPIQGNYFAGLCSMGRSGGSGGRWATLCVAALVIALFRRRPDSRGAR